eukprot:TRINITY_DN124796_c0_g1_i1.p1 TRINITY_DN124796_c0_g1~~TRINITY_DN124796_c0_g1_i1.p1  ORF type:complete len:473 (+),score=78.29 TRINITY_DN124796_c0_g1_i1:75-1421(+)
MSSDGCQFHRRLRGKKVRRGFFLSLLLASSTALWRARRPSLSSIGDLANVGPVSLGGKGPSTSSLLPAGLRLVIFDLCGTTLYDILDGEPLAVGSLRAAFARLGLEAPRDLVHSYRGYEKREAIRLILKDILPTISLAEEDTMVEDLFLYFQEGLRAGVNSGMLREIPGTSEVFRELRSAGMRVVIASGFPDEIVHTLIEKLGWEVDGVVGAAQRPRPEAVFKAMSMAGVQDVRRILKVGDTIADVEEGRRAGVWTAAVLTGTQNRAGLQRAGPHFILRSVADIPLMLPADDHVALQTPSIVTQTAESNVAETQTAESSVAEPLEENSPASATDGDEELTAPSELADHPPQSAPQVPAAEELQDDTADGASVLEEEGGGAPWPARSDDDVIPSDDSEDALSLEEQDDEHMLTTVAADGFEGEKTEPDEETALDSHDDTLEAAPASEID